MTADGIDILTLGLLHISVHKSPESLSDRKLSSVLPVSLSLVGIKDQTKSVSASDFIALGSF